MLTKKMLQKVTQENVIKCYNEKKNKKIKELKIF